MQFFEYPPGKPEGEGRPLTADQLERLTAVHPLLPTPALRDAATCFLFACHTGLAYVDLAAFRRVTHVVAGAGGRWLAGKRIKTGKGYRLPWPAACEVLLDGADRVPLASNPRYNLLLKVVADAAHLPADLSSHVARHTFIDRVRKLRLPEKEYELATGDTARVLKRHYERADDEVIRAAFGAPAMVGAPPAPRPAAPETLGRPADRRGRFTAEELAEFGQ